MDPDDVLASVLDPYLESFNAEQSTASPKAPARLPDDVRRTRTSDDLVARTALQHENAALREKLEKLEKERDEARGTITAMRSVMQRVL